MLALQLWPSWLESYLKQGCNDVSRYGKTLFHFLWMADLMFKLRLEKYVQTESKIGKFKKENDNGKNWKQY